MRLLGQGKRVPTHDEALVFGLRAKQLSLVREVALCLGGQPRVFAHTILPMHPRGAVTGWLSRLGERSLGSMLFSRPGFSRDAFHFKRLDRRHPLHARAVAALALPADTRLYARRSLFTYGKQTILVTEAFSPDVVRL